MMNIFLNMAPIPILVAVSLLGVILKTHEAVEQLIAIYVLAASLAFCASIFSRQRSGIDFMISMFFLVFLGLPGLAQISIGYFPWGAKLAPEHLALAISLLSVCHLFYIIGVSAGLSRHQVPKAIPKPLDAGFSKFYTKWAWGIAIIASAICVTLGPNVLFAARFGGQDAYVGISQQLLFISRSISLVAIVMIITLTRWAISSGLRRQNMIALLVYLPFFFVNNYFQSLPRFVLFGLLISVSCCFIDYRKPIVKLATTLVAIFMLFTVFPVIKLIAAEGATFDKLIESIQRVSPSRYLLNVDFDGFMQITSTIQYLESEPIRWGNNFLGVVLFFVPRGLWEGKPIDTGVIVSEGLGYWYNNVASPLPAEALMGIGLVGPIIVFLLLGFFVARIEHHAGSLGRTNRTLHSFFLYAVTMGFITIIMRGALNAVAPQFASGFVVLGLIWFARRNRIVWRADPA